MPDTSSENIARALLDIGAVGFTPDAPITFKSGILSPVYVDNRILPYHPAAWQLVIQAMQDRIAQESLTFDVIAGIETGGIPHSAALGYAMQRPSLFVRKQPKEHGKQRRVEGGEVADKRVLLIEDLITTGGSSLSGVDALREAEAIVTDCLVIASYGFEEAITNFAAAGVQIHALFTFDTVLKVAAESGKFNTQTLDTVRQWLGDPRDWSTRYTDG
jgi:orotate phosphoribosyltransferase